MLNKIKLSNWKSHINSELDFSSGVNVLVGEMGSGKSSVLDAISFALYGTTPSLQSKSLRLDSLIRREPQKAQESEISLTLKLNEDVYSIKRKIKRGRGTTEAELRKNGVLLEGPSSKKVTEEVEKVLKMDFDLFSRAVYSEQNNLDYFLNLRAGDRKKKIDELLKLNRFELARKNGVTLLNRIKNLKENTFYNLEEIKKDKEIQEIPNIQNEITELKEKLEKSESKLQELSKKLNSTREEFEILNSKKEKSEKLKEKKAQLQGELERIKTLISKDAEKYKVKISGFPPEDLGSVIKNIEEKISKLENSKKKSENIEKEILKLEALLSRPKKELELFEENKERSKEFSEICKNIETQESEIKKFERELDEKEAEIKELKKHISHIRKNSRCPICLGELNSEKKDKLIAEKGKRIEELEDENKNIISQLEKLKNSLKELKTKREALTEFKNIEIKISKKKEEIEILNKDIKNLKEELDKLERDRPKQDLEELKAIKRVVELKTNEEELLEKLDYANKKINELGFNEPLLENKRDEKYKLEKNIEIVRSEKNSYRVLLNEKERYLKILKEKKEKLRTLEKEFKNQEYLIEFLSKFMSALEITQTSLRLLFVDTVNKVMQELWERIYPYQDYNAIRLDVSEDYVLRLRNGVGDWVSVDGEVSGGERHSAALVLRVAFALVLAPLLKIIILDEPTHNLDVRAIEDLAKTLRTRVSNLIDQIFVITHEERLENAVTGNLYKFKKKGTESGLTEISKVTPD